LLFDRSKTHFGHTLLKYVQHLRFTLLVRGLAPFDLGGVRMIQQLTTLEASLSRAQEKGGIAY